MGVDNVGGVFVVLGIGCGMAAAMGGFEFLWHVREVAIEQKVITMISMHVGRCTTSVTGQGKWKFKV